MNYDPAFYLAQQEGSLQSAREVVPLIVAACSPRSVADVGCGVGTWAATFIENGVADVTGFDGNYVQRDMLKIPADHFEVADLTQPLVARRPFDVALCVEVAEHLPAISAGTLVESLTRLAPVVVFSAAIPFQGGTEHVNEQWPSYWAALFKSRGYMVVDALRPLVWRNEKIEPFYRQNLIVFVKAERLYDYPQLMEARQQTREEMLDLVHPRSYVGRNSYPMGPISTLLTWILKRGCGCLKRSVRVL